MTPRLVSAGAGSARDKNAFPGRLVLTRKKHSFALLPIRIVSNFPSAGIPSHFPGQLPAAQKQDREVDAEKSRFGDAPDLCLPPASNSKRKRIYFHPVANLAIAWEFVYPPGRNSAPLFRITAGYFERCPPSIHSTQQKALFETNSAGIALRAIRNGAVISSAYQLNA